MNAKWVYSIKHTQNLTEKKAQLQIIILAKLWTRKEKNMLRVSLGKRIGKIQNKTSWMRNRESSEILENPRQQSKTSHEIKKQKAGQDSSICSEWEGDSCLRAVDKAGEGNTGSKKHTLSQLQTEALKIKSRKGGRISRRIHLHVIRTKI